MKNKLIKAGYVAIEAVVIAAVCIIGGLAGTSAFLKNGQNAQGQSAEMINNTIEMIGEDFNIEIGGGELPIEEGIRIGVTEYETLQAAIDAAESGDTIKIFADISDVAVTIEEDIVISGDAVLNNVTFNINGADEVTISGLTFMGNSWINSGTAEKLTVTNVTANVTPSNTAQTNSRSAFISLGRSETQELELVVKNCDISVKSGGSNPILGWASIKKADIIDNTIDSQSGYSQYSDSIKFMNFADDAVINVMDNTVYSDYNGIVFGQNTTINNAYTVNIDGNDFIGGADHIWVEVNGTNTVHATINATSNNTVNGNTFTKSHIAVHPNIKTWTSYAGVDVIVDASGKIVSGDLAFYNASLLAE